MKDGSTDFYMTDELQYCRHLGDRSYEFIEAIWLDMPESDKEYAVFSGSIDLNDCEREEIERAILGYYPSLDDMYEAYQVTPETASELDDLIAECVFEDGMEHNLCHGEFTREEAAEFIEGWIQEHSGKEEMEIDLR